MTTITCPHCHQAFDLDDVLSHQHEAELKASLAKQEQILKRELWEKAQTEAAKKLKQEFAQDQVKQHQAVVELQQKLSQQEQRAKTAEQKELELLRKQRDLEQEKQQFELKIERELGERLKLEQEKSTKLENERFALKELEYKKQIDDLRALAEEARRKTSTVSQQLQGEVLELQLEELLQQAFPQDIIEEVKKGQSGADLTHIVHNHLGKPIGTIVWESKQTEHFSDKWLPKLREDTRASGGSVAVLVTRTLPDDVKTCAERDRVWITAIEFVLPLATLLRQTILKVDLEKTAQSGKDIKTEMLYRYINSHEFRGRVEAIVESFQEMKDDLDKEQRALQLSWKKREKQIMRLATNTAYMYGEMQGLVGASLPTIQGLELQEKLPDKTE